MTVNTDECRFESYQAPLGREYGVEAGRVITHTRVTDIATGVAVVGHSREQALNKLTNLLASPEQRALVDAMSWSNANCHFGDSDYRTNNDLDHQIARDILRGLAHLGWEIVKRP